MAGPVFKFLAQDHARLDTLLTAASATPGSIDLTVFGAFREGLLRHIAWEEKILIPAATQARHGEPLPVARTLRIEHGALAALLVPTPTFETVNEIRKILAPHNAQEEGPGGLYDCCDLLLSAPVKVALIERMRSYPPVKVAQCRDGPRVYRTAEDALRVSALQWERRHG